VLQVLGSMQKAYVTLTSARQGQNSQYINELITTMVSIAQNTSQIHITNAIGASRYMIRKALEHHVHVDETKENMWGGLLRKRRFDMISEGDCHKVLKWWETNTIVSLIQKDVKQKHMSAKVFEQHPTHYMQKFQVHLLELCGV
jgi:hypothetical protein